MGRVGPALANALRAAGHSLVGVAARSKESRERADSMLPGVPVVDDVELAKSSDILFLAVPDGQIRSLTKRLVDAGGIRAGQIVIHVSGAQGIDVLEDATAVGALPIALHPALTFSGTSLDVKAMEGLPFGYTCSPVAQPLAASLISSIGGVPFLVYEEDRPLYHAALAHGSNHVLTVVSQAARALQEAGVEDTEEVLGPLVKATVDRALREGIRGLTGPVQRGDTGTVDLHLEALGQVPALKNVERTYRDLTRATLRELGRDPRTTSDPELLRTKAQVADTLKVIREGGAQKIGLVMTMGALHEGHLSLVRRLKEDHDAVLVTIFVNPEQFGEGEDFDRYPRDLEADMQRLAEVGANWVYAPSADEVYPIPPRVRIQPGPAAAVLEGALRPGHFAGVLQVVGKVMDLVRPTTAIFGQKDAQQFVNIRQMVEDLDQQIALVEAPIVREEDGVAMSSRNAYLDASQRVAAKTLSKALKMGSDLSERGIQAPEVVAATAAVFAAMPQVEAEYVALADQDSFELLALWAPTPEAAKILSGGQTSLAAERLPLGTVWVPDAYLEKQTSGKTAPSERAAYLLVAAKVGSTRLIDNMKVKVRTSE